MERPTFRRPTNQPTKRQLTPAPGWSNTAISYTPTPLLAFVIAKRLKTWSRKRSWPRGRHATASPDDPRGGPGSSVSSTTKSLTTSEEKRAGGPANPPTANRFPATPLMHAADGRPPLHNGPAIRPTSFRTASFTKSSSNAAKNCPRRLPMRFVYARSKGSQPMKSVRFLISPRLIWQCECTAPACCYANAWRPTGFQSAKM